MPGDESVITAFSDPVITCPVTSSVSIASRPAALPLCTPLDTMRAAVRCAAPMPSPRKRITLRARGRPRCPAPAQTSTRRRDSADVPSAVVARITSVPAFVVLNRRARKFRLLFAAPSCARGSFLAVHSCPSTHTRRPAGGAAPSLVASILMSTIWPAASTPPSGGMMRMVVAASRGPVPRSRAARASRVGRMARDHSVARPITYPRTGRHLAETSGSYTRRT